MGRPMARTERWYRKTKQILNKYHKFSFNLPRKGKPLTGHQKSSITRLWNKHGDAIAKVEKNKWSFIKKKPGVGLDHIPHTQKTNLGIFFNAPGAKVVKKKRSEKPRLVISFRKMREFYMAFPDDILGNMDLIKIFVEGWADVYDPDYMMWAVNGNMGRIRYDPQKFQQYASQLQEGLSVYGKQFSKDMLDANAQGKDFLSGIFFGWMPPDSLSEEKEQKRRILSGQRKARRLATSKKKVTKGRKR